MVFKVHHGWSDFLRNLMIGEYNFCSREDTLSWWTLGTIELVGSLGNIETMPVTIGWGGKSLRSSSKCNFIFQLSSFSKSIAGKHRNGEEWTYQYPNNWSEDSEMVCFSRCTETISVEAARYVTQLGTLDVPYRKSLKLRLPGGFQELCVGGMLRIFIFKVLMKCTVKSKMSNFTLFQVFEHIFTSEISRKHSCFASICEWKEDPSSCD